jgi:catechol 2,3-dioxygenase-like lactoylglutathione lyase family enzyme
MKIGRLLHAALLVKDLQRARKFYGGVLGLKEKPRYDFDFAGEWYDLGECELHLMVTTERLSPVESRPRRDHHIALEVDDLETAKRALQTAGLAFRASTSGRASVFVRDPDGNLIELQERSRQ